MGGFLIVGLGEEERVVEAATAAAALAPVDGGAAKVGAGVG